VRATVQARALGHDTTVLELTTSDYLLTSIGVLFVPFVAVLLIAAALRGLTLWLLGRYTGHRPAPRWVKGCSSACRGPPRPG